MAVLQKIRGWGIWLSLIIALALLIFLLGDQSLTSWLFNKNVYVGKIGDEKIKYEEFNEELASYQMVSGNSSKENPFEIEDVAWNSLMMEHLFIPQANEAGIYVTENEVAEGMEQLIQSQFGITLREYIDILNSGDEQMDQQKAYYNLRSKQMRYMLYTQKYGALFNGLDFDNNLVKKSNIALNSTVATSVDMIVIMPTEPKAEITVSDDEIKARYNERLFMQTERSRDVAYAVFHILPSEEDVKAAAEDFDAIVAKAAEEKNLEKYIVRNSEMKNVDYYRAGGLRSVDPSFEEAIFEGGADSAPVVYDSRNHRYSAAYVIESGMMSDNVTIEAYSLNAEESVDADSLLTDLKAGLDDEAIADKYGFTSQEMTFNRNQRIVLKNVYDAPEGEFVREDLSDGSVAIYKVTEKSEPELLKKVAVLRKTVNPSAATEKACLDDAQRFYALAKDGTKAFIDNAAQSGSGLIYNATVTDRTTNYQGLNTTDPTFDGRSLTRSIYSNDDSKDLTPGKVSEIIKNGENYIIVASKSETEAGYPSLESVRTSLESEIRAEKTRAAVVAETAEKIKGLTDLDAMAEALGTEVQNREVKYSDFVNPYYGTTTSQKFIGAVIAAKEGHIYGPIDGGEVIYIFRVNGKDTGAFYDDSTASMLDNQRRYVATQSILGVMAENAKVENNVARYF